MLRMFKSFIKDESGMETVEWAIMLALIVGAVITAVVTIKGKMGATFTSAASTMP